MSIAYTAVTVITAIVTHVRAGVLYNIAFPGAYLLASTACLVLLAAQ